MSTRRWGAGGDVADSGEDVGGVGQLFQQASSLAALDGVLVGVAGGVLLAHDAADDAVHVDGADKGDDRDALVERKGVAQLGDGAVGVGVDKGLREGGAGAGRNDAGVQCPKRAA